MGGALGVLPGQRATAPVNEPTDGSGGAHEARPRGGPTGARLRRRWEFWRSPADQPAWARPALLGVAALALLSYCWGIGNATLETYYGAAVRSMSENWHNFFFGAFDPWGTVSVDKLPGAFWVQALSVRLLGFHEWSLVVPQAVEGALTVLVLFRAVRRVAGAAAGLAAAVVLAATPIVILLDRGNISDTLLILLLVLAADAATAACTTGSLRHLVVAGVWVGLAFQAKMLQAWIVLPALGAAYLLAAPVPTLTRRVGHVALATVAAVAVSLSYVAVVSAVPARDRPYVDGSCNDSLFSQVFLYNAANRVSGGALDRPGCNPPPAVVALSATDGEHAVALPEGPTRFLTGGLARDVDFMLVPALVALGAVLVNRRRAPRGDPLRAATVLWATWLFLTWCLFASSRNLNAYYLAALAPPIAALCGFGVSVAWERRDERSTQLVLCATVLVGCSYALALIPGSAGVHPWVLATTILLVLGALAATGWRLARGGGHRGRAVSAAGVVLSAGALLVGSAWAAGTVVAAELGPFDAPYQAASLTAGAPAARVASARLAEALQLDADRVPPSVSVLTGETSAESAVAIFDTGREFLPVGGYSGRVPSPTVAQFTDDVRRGRIRLVVAAVAPRPGNPDLRWALAHCAPMRSPSDGAGIAGRALRLYECSPADAG
ncbi:MAG TPA: glycosyltransferase family 39 protein [Acidimicrobiales bacterium]|nr:glycosyltransferase family 39 protein [Acidimicrobiales bacterium]